MIDILEFASPPLFQIWEKQGGFDIFDGPYFNTGNLSFPLVPDLGKTRGDSRISVDDDFKDVKSKIEKMFDKLNTTYFYGEQRLVAKFLPQCHPELAEIERHQCNVMYHGIVITPPP